MTDLRRTVTLESERRAKASSDFRSPGPLPIGLECAYSAQIAVGKMRRADVSVIDLLDFDAYVGVDRTRPASIRKDMHTGRVFYFRAKRCRKRAV